MTNLTIILTKAQNFGILLPDKNKVHLNKSKKERKMKDITARAIGKVIDFKNNDIIAILETKDGEVYIDINTDFPISLKIGDNVEIETGSYYISNGRFVYVVDKETFLSINGWVGMWTEQISLPGQKSTIAQLFEIARGD